MKTIAVIGYHSMHEFVEDCQRAGCEPTNVKNIFICGDKKYVGIFRHSDLVGRRFDDYIDHKSYFTQIYDTGYTYLLDEVKRRCYAKN